MGRGVARLYAKDLVGGIEDFAAAKSRWWRMLAPALLLGKTYYLKGDVKSAERTFTDLYDGSTSKDEAAAWIAVVYKTLADYKKGLEWAERVENEAVKMRLCADRLFRFHRMQEAIQAARRTIELDPDDHVARVVHLPQSGGTARPATGQGVRGTRRSIEDRPRAQSVQLHGPLS